MCTICLSYSVLLLQAADGCLTGLSFHFSGNPRNFSIKLQLKTFIKRYNGVYHSFFNKYTKYLIVGHHPKRKVLNEVFEIHPHKISNNFIYVFL